MDAKCRICHRPSVDNFDPATTTGIAVCRLHRTMLSEALRESTVVERHQRALGFGLALYRSDSSGIDVPLRCDRATVDLSAHTWSGDPGDPCPFCLALYVEALVEERNRLLSRIEFDIDDARYPDEVLRRAKGISRAVILGLITPDEAKTQIERWSAHV